jgi:hypothetical protein
MLGLATAWTTLAPFPTDRCYPQAAAGLGPDHTADWLVGAREMDELAARSAARGTGLADSATAGRDRRRPQGRSWLLTSAARVSTGSPFAGCL